jgi:GYF domain 2
MKYYIQRQLNEYGPYTLADLQRYVAQGSILLTDLTRSEGMTDWVPVSQVIGNIPAPQPAALPVAGAAMSSTGMVYGSSGTVYGGPESLPGGGVTAYGGGAAINSGPVPPDFHWALVLLVNFFCNFFQVIWLFVEAAFVKKIDRESKGVALLAGSLVTIIVGTIVLFSSIGVNGRQGPSAAVMFPFFLIIVAGVVLHLMGIFQMRSSIETYYNTVEPINLRLSGVMTFFFAVFYFQYHFTRIANWKRTGYLPPQ